MNNNEKTIEALKRIQSETSTLYVEAEEDTASPFYDRFGEACRKVVIGKDPNAYFRFVFVGEKDLDKITDNEIILGDMKELIRDTCNCFFYVYELGPDTYHSICCIRGYLQQLICHDDEDDGEMMLPPTFFTTNAIESEEENPNANRLGEIYMYLTECGFVDLEMINNFENTYLFLLSEYYIRRHIFKKYFIREYEFEQKKNTTKETGVYDSAANE